MDQQTGISILLFVIFSLFAGALLRHLLRNVSFPYTIALLLLGLAVGMLQRGGALPDSLDFYGQSLPMVAEIDPHLIMFLFLPTLIFESAFAMEVHLFRRAFLQIVILAVPGLLVSTVLTALIAKTLFPWDWSWPTAFLFGSLISATDPVAVVALLKELSSRKRLETLLEGESLLNDGTAIILFALFYQLIVTEGPQVTGWPLFPLIAWQFTWGVCLGLLVGITFALLTIFLIGKVFKDAMVEITLSVAGAYFAFIAAEALFHVSGVVAVVAYALLLTGIGRTKISPEISEFLHHFWEMMAYIANTLIFLLVGIIIAMRVRLDSPAAWQTLLLLFGAILLIRAISICLFLPLLQRIGLGLTKEKTAVLIWGGLRGAVALAMALTLAQDKRIPAELGDQILFLTAGIVVLTLLINGTTMPMVLRMLGLNKLPPAKQATVDRATVLIRNELLALLPKLRKNAFFQDADWLTIHTMIDQGVPETRTDKKSGQAATERELEWEFKRRLLEAERKSYWTQFHQGLLGGTATHFLIDAVEKALDEIPTIAPRPLLFTLWEIPPLIRYLEKIPFIRKMAVKGSFDRLALGYDVARGFIHAQDTNLGLIEQLAPSAMAAAAVRKEILINKKDTYDRIEQLRRSFPEVITALQTLAASQSLLNRRRRVIEKLIETGLLDTAEAGTMLKSMDEYQKTLRNVPIRIEIPEPRDFIKLVVWLDNVAPAVCERLLSAMDIRLYAGGEMLRHRGDSDGSLTVIFRGSVEIRRIGQNEDVVEDVLGPGTVLGIHALLDDCKEEYSVQARGFVEALRFNGTTMRQLIKEDHALAGNLRNVLLERMPKQIDVP